MNKQQKKEFLDLFSEAFHDVVIPAIQDSEERIKEELRKEIRETRSDLKKEIRENRKSMKSVDLKTMKVDDRVDECEEKLEDLEKRIAALEEQVLPH